MVALFGVSFGVGFEFYGWCFDGTIVGCIVAYIGVCAAFWGSACLFGGLGSLVCISVF